MAMHPKMIENQEALKFINSSDIGGWENYRKLIDAALKQKTVKGIVIGVTGATLVFGGGYCIKKSVEIFKQVREQRKKLKQIEEYEQEKPADEDETDN